MENHQLFFSTQSSLHFQHILNVCVHILFAQSGCDVVARQQAANRDEYFQSHKQVMFVMTVGTREEIVNGKRWRGRALTTCCRELGVNLWLGIYGEMEMLNQTSPLTGWGCEPSSPLLPSVAPVLGISQGVPIVTVDCLNDMPPSGPCGWQVFAFGALDKAFATWMLLGEVGIFQR